MKNIHVRIEDSIFSSNFAFGITLQSIEMFTVNDKGERSFIDRSKVET
jgi:hypothetical protein